jgi:hypothetical protein
LNLATSLPSLPHPCHPCHILAILATALTKIRNLLFSVYRIRMSFVIFIAIKFDDLQLQQMTKFSGYRSVRLFYNWNKVFQALFRLSKMQFLCF